MRDVHLQSLIVLALVILLLTATNQSSAVHVLNSSASSSWPTLEGDQGRTGFFSGRAPENPTISWTFKTGAAILASPVIYGGRVYIASTDHSAYALNETSGSLIWRTELGGVSADSTPTTDGKSLFVGVSGAPFLGVPGYLYRLNSSNGGKIWRIPFEFPTNGLLLIDQTLFVLNGTVGVLSGPPGGNVYSINAITGQENWSFNITSPSEIAYARGLLYLGSYSTFPPTDRNIAKIYAINASTGNLVWSFDIPETIDSGVSTDSGVVYAGSLTCGAPGSTQKLYAINATSGHLIWSVGATPWGIPSVAYDTIFAGNSGALYAFNQSTGAQIWWQRTGLWICGGYNSNYSEPTPAVADGRVFSAADGVEWVNYSCCVVANLNSYDTRTGALIWSLRLPSQIRSPLSITDGVIFAGSIDGRLYAIGNANFASYVPLALGLLGSAILLTVVVMTLRKHKAVSAKTLAAKST